MANDGTPGEARKASKASATASNHGGAAESLEHGSCYPGKVGVSDSRGNYSVQLDRGGNPLDNVERLMSPFCSLLGLKDLVVLHPGTPVVVLYGSNGSYIMGVRDTDLPGQTPGRVSDGRLMVGGIPETKVQQAAVDALSGEVELENARGVGIRFLTFIMQMKAGDRAKVECCAINEMVRIISAQFRHISPMGDELMFDHGRPTMEKGWSSYRHELFGLLKEGDMLYDEKTLFGDRIKKQGRHRLIDFVGHAGDMVHSWIADPAKALFELVGTPPHADQVPSGKSWVHRAMDGSLIMQSVADIRLERVVRIPVPVRIKSHEDPQLERHYETMTAEMNAYLKTWGNAHPGRRAFQMREYSRWLTRFAAFARFMQHPDEYYVPSEGESAAPDQNCQESDRTSVNGTMSPLDSYSVIAINRDGSALMFGQGASVVMAAGNLQMSASRHVTIEASGDLRLIAGGSIFMKARRHIELVATAGAIVMYSYTGLRMLCEAGATMIKSCMKPRKDGLSPPRFPGLKDSKDADLQPDQQDFAVTVETPNGKAAVRASRGMLLATEHAPDLEGDPELIADNNNSAILFSSAGNIRMKSKGSTVVVATQDVIVAPARNLLTTANSWRGSINDVSLNNGAIVMKPTSGIISCQTMHADSANIYRSIFAPENTGTNADPAANPAVDRHLNHVGKFMPGVQDAGRERAAVNANSAKADKALGLALSFGPAEIAPWRSETEGPKWGFLPKAAYEWDTFEDVKGALVETLAQQTIRLEHTFDTSSGAQPDKSYIKWDWTSATFATPSAGRQDPNLSKSFGQDIKISRQEDRSAQWPSLFKKDTNRPDHYKASMADHPDSHWTSTHTQSFSCWRPG